MAFFCDALWLVKYPYGCIELCFGSRLVMVSSCFGVSVWPCVCRSMPPLNAANPTTEGCSGSCPDGLPRTCTATETSQNCPPSQKVAGMRAKGESPVTPEHCTLGTEQNSVKSEWFVTFSFRLMQSCDRPDLMENPKLSGQLGRFRFLKKQPTHPPRPCHCTPQRFSLHMIKACFQFDEQEVSFLVCSKT